MKLLMITSSSHICRAASSPDPNTGERLHLHDDPSDGRRGRLVRRASCPSACPCCDRVLLPRLLVGLRALDHGQHADALAVQVAAGGVRLRHAACTLNCGSARCCTGGGRAAPRASGAARPQCGGQSQTRPPARLESSPPPRKWGRAGHARPQWRRIPTNPFLEPNTPGRHTTPAAFSWAQVLVADGGGAPPRRGSNASTKSGHASLAENSRPANSQPANSQPATSEPRRAGRRHLHDARRGCHRGCCGFGRQAPPVPRRRPPAHKPRRASAI